MIRGVESSQNPDLELRCRIQSSELWGKALCGETLWGERLWGETLWVQTLWDETLGCETLWGETFGVRHSGVKRSRGETPWSEKERSSAPPF